MFNKNIRKCCCFPGFFEEKATRTEVKYAFERIDQLEKLISTVTKTKQQSAQIEESVRKKTKASRKKKKHSVSKPKVDVKVCSDGKNNTEMLIKLSCGCILKKSQHSQKNVSSISTSSSAVDKCTPPQKLNPSCEDDLHGLRFESVIKLTSDTPVKHQESELKLILKNEPVKVSKEQVFQEPNIIKSLSTCGCGLEGCKMEWNFPCSERNNTPTSDPLTVKSMFNAQKRLIDCGINTLDLSKTEPMVERIKKKVAICQDDGSISKNDGSSVSPCTRLICISTQTCDNSCPDDSSLFDSTEYRLHCSPSPMAASGKDRKNRRSVKCNPMRQNISRSDLSRLTKSKIPRPKKNPKKKKSKCCNRNKNKNKTSSVDDKETSEANCEEPILVSPQNTVRFKKKKSPKNNKSGSSEIDITQSDIPSCSTNFSELSNDSYVCEEIPKLQKKNAYIIRKVVKNPQHIVKCSKQFHPAYIIVEPSKKRCREESVVQSSFHNAEDDSESTASGYTKCK